MSDFPHYDALMATDVYPADRIQADALFHAAMRESLAYHTAHCPAFARYCRNHNFSSKAVPTTWADYPYIPVQAFKTFGRDLLISRAEGEKSFFMHSSATSGQPSSISVSRSTAKRQTVSMARVMATYLGSKKRPFIIFDVNPKAENGDLGARYGATVGYMRFASQSHFVLEATSQGIHLNAKRLSAALELISTSDEPPVIFGFTYVLFDVLKSIVTDGPLVHLNAGTILHIGGWKKLETQKVSKTQFNLLVAEGFGLQTSDVIDVYGFTEQMGVNYPSIDSDDKITPGFSRVLVRDPETLHILPDGREGLLQFISPLPLSYPGISVLTDDMGVITQSFGTLRSRWGTTFQITGRAKHAEVRGCGDIMSAYLTRKPTEGIQTKITLPKPRLLFLEQNYISQQALEATIDFDDLPVIEDLPAIARQLHSNLQKLQRYTVDDLISFFAEAAKSWLDADSPMRHLQQHGLSFLVHWLNADNLRAITNKSLKGTRLVLDRFVPDPEFPGRLLRASHRGIVGHWLAGNVPLLGMLGLVQAILTKNANIIRVPAANSAVMPIILDVISQTKVSLIDGTIIDGTDIANSTVILYYDKQDTICAHAVSQLCDARIAWGGAEAVAAVAALPAKIDCQTIIYGPKLSYMAIGQEMLHTESNTEKLFRRIATDCSVFDQYACASPHTLFVETNAYFSPEAFCEHLAHHMAQIANRIPKDTVSAGTATKILAKRTEYQFRGTVWQSEGTIWSIVYDPAQKQLAEPTYSRFVTVIFVDDILEAAQLAHADIQTIALAMSYEKKIQFAEIALAKGAIRFPEIGRMTHFEAPWDGLFMMDRLVRFVTLGGPMV